MLALTRKPGEELLIGDSIRIVVVKSSKSKVYLRIDAPKDVLILRTELLTQAVQEVAHQE